MINIPLVMIVVKVLLDSFPVADVLLKFKSAFDFSMPIPRYKRYNPPRIFNIKNACAFIFKSSDERHMLVIKWGIIPRVHPRAAIMLILFPLINPVEIVYITPVPGSRIIMNEVRINV